MTQQEKQQQEKQETVIKIEKRNFVVPGETIYSRDIPFAAFASEIGNMFRNIFTDCVGVYYDHFTMPNTNMIFPTLSVLFTPNATRGTSDDGRLTALIGKSVNSQSRFERYRARETARVNNVQYTLSDEAKNILAKYIYDNYPLQKVNRKNIKNVDWNAIVTLQKTMPSIDPRSNTPTISTMAEPSKLIQETIIRKFNPIGIGSNVNTVYERVTGLDPRKLLKEYYCIDGIDQRDLEFEVKEIKPRTRQEEYVLHISATSVNTINKTLNALNQQIVTTQKIY